MGRTDQILAGRLAWIQLQAILHRMLTLQRAPASKTTCLQCDFLIFGPCTAAVRALPFHHDSHPSEPLIGRQSQQHNTMAHPNPRPTRPVGLEITPVDFVKEFEAMTLAGAGMGNTAHWLPS